MLSMRDRAEMLRSATAQERIVLEASFWLGTPYQLGAKLGQSWGGMYGVPRRPTDCSGFVIGVFESLYPEAGLNRLTQNVAAIRTSSLWNTVGMPETGDLVCWQGHVGIVNDLQLQTFIGAQSSTGVAIASYASGYWSQQPHRIFRRWTGL
jgi:cell wall-associated NlpC family hydrolase